MSMVITVARALVYASAVALGSAGITIVYSSTKTFNFAHASLVSWGAYVLFTMTRLYGGPPHKYLPLAFLVGGLLGLLTYFAVNRRLLMLKAPDINLMMSTLGVDIALFAALNMYVEYLAKVYRWPDARNFVFEVEDPYVTLLGQGIRLGWVLAPLILASMVVVIHLLFSKTMVGLAMRAIMEGPELAQAQGVNPDAVYALSWFLGCALAGLSGGLMILVLMGRTTLGMEVVVALFAGAIVGGLHSAYGGFLGGLFIGLCELLLPVALIPYVGGWIAAYRPVIPLIAMVIMLLFQPSGLAGVVEGLRARRGGRR